MAQENNIKKTFAPVTVDSVSEHTQNQAKIKAGILNAQIRQVVTTTYPSVQIKNGGLFDVDDYGVAGQEFNSTRVTWMDVPAGMTAARLQELLAAKPNARIAAIYSNKLEDVMTDGQKYAVKNGDQTLEFFENKLRIRGANGEELPGAPQYRNYEFDAKGREDVDLRTVKNSSNAATETTEMVEAAGAGQKVI